MNEKPPQKDKAQMFKINPLWLLEGDPRVFIDADEADRLAKELLEDTEKIDTTQP